MDFFNFKKKIQTNLKSACTALVENNILLQAWSSLNLNNSQRICQHDSSWKAAQVQMNVRFLKRIPSGLRTAHKTSSVAGKCSKLSRLEWDGRPWAFSSVTVYFQIAFSHSRITGTMGTAGVGAFRVAQSSAR